MQGILVVGHGSRREEARRAFYQIVNQLGEKLKMETEGCFMEISAPYIPETIEKMIEKGVTDIKVQPYFLFEGIHIKEDIPEILRGVKKKHPTINITMASPIGFHTLLVDILADRIEGETQCI